MGSFVSVLIGDPKFDALPTTDGTVDLDPADWHCVRQDLDMYLQRPTTDPDLVYTLLIEKEGSQLHSSVLSTLSSEYTARFKDRGWHATFYTNGWYCTYRGVDLSSIHLTLRRL